MRECKPDGVNKHDLKVISRERSADGLVDKVVRWCAQCGAVVVDAESDGRLRPGYFMPLRRPEWSKSDPVNGE